MLIYKINKIIKIFSINTIYMQVTQEYIHKQIKNERQKTNKQKKLKWEGKKNENEGVLKYSQWKAALVNI